MRRRLLIWPVIMIAILAGWPVGSGGGNRVYRLGVINLVAPTAHVVSIQEGLLHDVVFPELAKQGFVLGENLATDLRNGTAEQLPRLAREVIALQPDAILAIAPPAVRASAAATSTIPIIALVSADPVQEGWVAGLAKPGGNISGVTILARELDVKRLQLLHELAPGASRVGLLRDPALASEPRTRELEAAARALGLNLEIVDVQDPADFASAMRRVREHGAEALNVLASPLFSTGRQALAAAALDAGLASICHYREMAEAGCLASYGPDRNETWRVAAAQLGRVLHGAPVAEMPVQQPSKFELIINLKTAKALGITISQSVLARADEVIE